MENSIDIPLKAKDRATILSSNPTPGHISGKDKNSNSKNYMHPSVHSSTIYNSQDMPACRLCDPMDHGPPGSSVQGILQARILEGVAIPFSSAKV